MVGGGGGGVCSWGGAIRSEISSWMPRLFFFPVLPRAAAACCCCSPDCQKAHWKTHKKQCRSGGVDGGGSGGSAPAAAGDGQSHLLRMRPVSDNLGPAYSIIPKQAIGSSLAAAMSGSRGSSLDVDALQKEHGIGMSPGTCTRTSANVFTVKVQVGRYTL